MCVPKASSTRWQLTASARAVLKGDVAIVLREPREAPAAPQARGERAAPRAARPCPPDVALSDAPARRASTRCGTWRAAVAREHNLPAYVVFHDATLLQMAQRAPATLDALAGISGVGAKKLEAYGARHPARAARSHEAPAGLLTAH